MDNPDKPESDAPESSVTGLSDLAHTELDEKPAESKAPESAPLPADMPAFGAPEAPPAQKEPEWEPPPMTVTFWQKLAPKSRFKPIHFILGGLLVVIAAGGAAGWWFVLRKQPQTTEGTAVAAATTAAPSKSETKPAKAAEPEKPAKPSSADEKTNASATGSAKTATTRTRSRDTRRTTSSSRKKTEEPAAAAKPAPAKPAPAEPAPEPAGEPLTVADIKAGVKKNMAKVRGCIKTARDSGVLEPGRHTLILDWTIAPSGAVTDAHVRGPKYVADTTFATCFSNAMRKWKFPASSKGAPVKNFPFGPFNLK